MKFSTATFATLLRRWWQPFFRLLIVAATIGSIIYLTYTTVYVPLHQEKPLPVSISSQDPALKSEVLQEINAARIKRSGAARRNFDFVQRIFVPIVTPVP